MYARSEHVETEKLIGILFGPENSFPSALVERVNSIAPPKIRAEYVQLGAIPIGSDARYAVILDRVSHDVPFYRSYLKQAALNGTIVVNNPFWWSADDKFFNYSLALRLGVAVPPTIMLPHKQLPHGITERSVRNLEFPLNWEAVFARIGEHGFLKPIDGGGGRDVCEVHSREEFFQAYDRTRDLCMVYQRAVRHTEYYRCYVLGGRKVRVMAYDPSRPHSEHYQPVPPGANARLLKRMERDAIKLSVALGYEVNTVEFAVENAKPYAIDFMNPVPDADLHSVGRENFEWMVANMADLLIAKAKLAPFCTELNWEGMLKPAEQKRKRKSTAKKKPAKKS